MTGPLLAYEVLTAFFLEAGFLGVMLFGWQRVGPGLHFSRDGDGRRRDARLRHLDPCLEQLDAHACTATTIVDGRIVPTDWLAVIFNPSFPYRLAHMVVASYLATALFVGASGAWHLLRGRDEPAIRTMTSMAMWMLLIVAPIQAYVGDSQGLNTLEYQPAKIAAIEGHWESKPGEAIPLTLVGWPDMAQEKTLFAVDVPHLGSLILTHSWDGQFPGLKNVSARRSPEFHGRVLDVSRDGRPRHADDPARPVVGVGALARTAVHNRSRSSASRSRWGRRASSPSWPAG